MIQINNSLLDEVGLGNLGEDDKKNLLTKLYETLELKVGQKLASQMSDKQLDEFDRYFQAKDEKGAFMWLESNFPNYKEIVQEQFDVLKDELKTSSARILESLNPGFDQNQNNDTKTN